jgi:hypothetical protein
MNLRRNRRFVKQSAFDHDEPLFKPRLGIRVRRRQILILPPPVHLGENPVDLRPFGFQRLFYPRLVDEIPASGWCRSYRLLLLHGQFGRL